MFGARKRGLIRQRLEIIRFFPLFSFYLAPNVSFKTTKKKSTFLSIRESLRREKFYFGQFARESLCSRNAKISRIFRLAKVSAPKVYGYHDVIIRSSSLTKETKNQPYDAVVQSFRVIFRHRLSHQQLLTNIEYIGPTKTKVFCFKI